MKNIHVLPTDKASIIHKALDNYFYLSATQTLITTLNKAQPINLYITSDEEIKEGDWFLEKAGRQYPIQWNGIEKLNFHCKKIILTTDELYIHNDLVPKEYNPSPQYVQKIDDEFLEWFVKNPSCEFVEVKNGVKRLNSDGEEIGFPDMSSYKIIIPKEENFKHELRVLSKEEVLTNRSSAYEFIDFDKQETLEEFIQTQLSLGKYQDQESAIRHSIELGAKWQAKRMYSEEEVKIMLFARDTHHQLNTELLDIEKWFEQFKKK